MGEHVRSGAAFNVGMSRTSAQVAVACAIVPMVATTLILAVTSDHLQRPVVAGLYLGYLTAASMAIGLYWSIRRPASRFGALLVTFGVLAWIVSLQSSDIPLVYDLAVLAEAPAWLLTIYLFLSFPMGRVEPRAARWVMGALAVGALVTFYAWALLSPVTAGGGPLTRCAPNCPENVLQIASAPNLAQLAGDLEIYAALALTFVAFVVYLSRLLTASRPQRRALLAVAVTSLLFLPAWFTANFAAWIIEIDDLATLDALAWAIVGARILLPLGFLVALLQADVFASRAQLRLLDELTERPSPARWRNAIADALDDDALELGYHEPATGRFRDATGGNVVPPPTGAHRAWVPVQRAQHPVAAMVIDETLTEDPELVRAAAAATLLAVENGALAGELRASRARILEAGIEERRRIERDLHDSAQQRLVALRVHLALAGERLDTSQERALIEQLGGEVEQAIDELRDVASGLRPQLLAQLGIGPALEAAARRSTIPVTVQDDGLRRHSEALETTVYFCCVESLQNAAKHAGPGASATVRLSQLEAAVRFEVVDDGVGFDRAAVVEGTGLTNLADRVAAMGGTLAIVSSPGHGTRVIGTVPARDD